MKQKLYKISDNADVFFEIGEALVQNLNQINPSVPTRKDLGVRGHVMFNNLIKLDSLS